MPKVIENVNNFFFYFIFSKNGEWLRSYKLYFEKFSDGKLIFIKSASLRLKTKGKYILPVSIIQPFL